MKEKMQEWVLRMADIVQMPPDIIRAIEVTASKGQTVEVRYLRNLSVWKVQEKTTKLLLARQV